MRIFGGRNGSSYLNRGVGSSYLNRVVGSSYLNRGVDHGFNYSVDDSFEFAE
jgi:hypothetical protein